MQRSRWASTGPSKEALCKFDSLDDLVSHFYRRAPAEDFLTWIHFMAF